MNFFSSVTDSVIFWYIDLSSSITVCVVAVSHTVRTEALQ